VGFSMWSLVRVRGMREWSREGASWFAWMDDDSLTCALPAAGVRPAAEVDGRELVRAREGG
jgi:hypothetical protein